MELLNNFLYMHKISKDLQNTLKWKKNHVLTTCTQWWGSAEAKSRTTRKDALKYEKNEKYFIWDFSLGFLKKNTSSENSNKYKTKKSDRCKSKAKCWILAMGLIPVSRFYISSTIYVTKMWTTCYSLKVYHQGSCDRTSDAERWWHF